MLVDSGVLYMVVDYLLYLASMVLVIVAFRFDGNIENMSELVFSYYRSRKHMLSDATKLCMVWFYGVILIKAIVTMGVAVLFIKLVSRIVEMHPLFQLGLLAWYAIAIVSLTIRYHRGYDLYVCAIIEHRYESYYLTANNIDTSHLSKKLEDALAGSMTTSRMMEYAIRKDAWCGAHVIVSIVLFIVSFYW